jgi:hypothetical protein
MNDLVTGTFTSSVRVGLHRFSIPESDEHGFDATEHNRSSEESGEGSSYAKDAKHRSHILSIWRILSLGSGSKEIHVWKVGLS